MDTQSRLAGLQFGERLVSFQQLFERLGITTEAIVILRHAVNGEFTHKQLQALLFEDVLQRFDRPLGKVPIRRHINLFDAVVLDEEPADLCEFGAQERFAAGQVQVLDPSQISCQRENLLHLQIIALIEVPPVKTVLARQVANGVDEENQKRRGRDAWKSQVSPSKLTVSDDTLNRVHLFMPRSGSLRAWISVSAGTSNLP